MSDNDDIKRALQRVISAAECRLEVNKREADARLRVVENIKVEIARYKKELEELE